MVARTADALPLAFGAMLLALLNVGCGGADGPVRIPVSGTVTVDELPLASGMIRFVPKDDKSGPGASTQIIDGVFRFSADDGPVIASHRVEIEAIGYQNFEIDDETGFAAEMTKTGKSPLATNPIPAIYNSKSTLTETVTDAADQSFQFAIKSSP